MTEEKRKAPAWERIEFEGSSDPKARHPAEMYRRKVPGGWLVAHGWGSALGPLVYVPDPAGTWDPYA